MERLENQPNWHIKKTTEKRRKANLKQVLQDYMEVTNPRLSSARTTKEITKLRLDALFEHKTV